MALATTIFFLLCFFVFECSARLTCFLDNQALYRPNAGSFSAKDFPSELCTHGVYSSVGVNSETYGLEILDSWTDVGNGGFQNFNKFKESNPQLKTAIAVGMGMGGPAFSHMAADPKKRTVFIASVIAFLNRWNFDGLDINWKFPGDEATGGDKEDKINLVSLLKEIKEAFAGRWELSIAVPVSRGRLDVGYDVKGVCQNVDVVHAMTFDLRRYGDEVQFADVHSPLHRRSFDEGAFAELNVEDGLKMLVDGGCPPSKLIVGVPLYGRSFYLGKDNTNYELHTPAEGPGSPGLLTGEQGFLAYYEICKNIKMYNWTEGWDDVGVVPFVYHDSTWVGYENEESVQAKAAWIKEEGYGGAMAVSVDLDDFKGTCGDRNPLLTALYNSLN